MWLGILLVPGEISWQEKRRAEPLVLDSMDSTDNMLTVEPIMNQIFGQNIEKDRKVIPDPIDDRKFQEWKESGKSGILLGITLNPKKCIGEKVRRIPINVESKW